MDIYLRMYSKDYKNTHQNILTSPSTRKNTTSEGFMNAKPIQKG